MRDLHTVLSDLADAFELHLGGRAMSLGVRTPEGDTPLHVAAVRGDAEAIAVLVRAGADVNARGDLGCTPLDEAVSQGHVEAARELLRLGASPHLRNELGTTAAERAKASGVPGLVAALEQYGAV